MWYFCYMKINIEETLEFFDGRHEKDRGHASAVVGVLGEDLNAAAFAHYMTSRGADVNVLDVPVTTGNKKGHWLDRWIDIRHEETHALYQTEIKNWSSWAIGGRQLSVTASIEEVQKVAQHHWTQQTNNIFVGSEPNGVTKVLLKMKLPVGYEGQEGRVEPLLIYWMPISNTESIEPFFSASVHDVAPNIETPFDELQIFSVSLYLRQLLESGTETIDLDMPNATARVKALSQILT